MNLTDFFCFIYGVQLLFAASYDQQLLLKGNLFPPNRYDPMSRPVKESNETVNFDIKLSYSSFILLEEDVQVLTIGFLVVINWVDHLLKWNPNDYEGLTSIVAKPSSIWLPKLSMIHSTQDNLLHVNDDSQFVVAASGRVQLVMGYVSKTVCLMEITKFPFDVQICEFYIIDSYYFATETKFIRVRLTSEDEPGSQWTVVNSSASTGIKYFRSVVNFKFVLRRQSSFYVMNIIIPLAITALLNPLVFLIPPTSGEKISVAVTTLLSYTVFFNIISGILPKTSKSISVLSMYIAALQALSAVYTSLCILIVKLDVMKVQLTFCRRGRRIGSQDKTLRATQPETQRDVHLDKLCFICGFTVSFVLTFVCLFYILF